MFKSFTAILACFLSNLASPYLAAIIPGPPAPAIDSVFEASQDHSNLLVPISPYQLYHPYFRQTARLDPKLKASIERLVQKYAKRHGVDETLVRAVLRQESGGNPQAVSPKGAMGLMQLMPDTAALMGVEDPFDPEDNVAGGVKYLKFCLKHFQNDTALALAAYNAGPGAVKKYEGVPPYRETQEYVAHILGGGTESKVTGQESKVVKRIQPGEVKPQSPQKTGLDYHLPQPTWNIPKTVYKVPNPKWNGCPSTANFNSLQPQKTLTGAEIVFLKNSASK